MTVKIHPVVDGALAWFGCVRRGGHSYDSQTQICVMCGAHAQGPTLLDILRMRAKLQGEKKGGKK